jgi:hypothetical protein
MHSIAAASTTIATTHRNSQKQVDISLLSKGRQGCQSRPRTSRSRLGRLSRVDRARMLTAQRTKRWSNMYVDYMLGAARVVGMAA